MVNKDFILLNHLAHVGGSLWSWEESSVKVVLEMTQVVGQQVEWVLAV